MKHSKNTIVATFTALLIGGLGVSPASAAVAGKEHSDTGASKQTVNSCAISACESDSKKEAAMK